MLGRCTLSCSCLAAGEIGSPGRASQLLLAAAHGWVGFGQARSCSLTRCCPPCRKAEDRGGLGAAGASGSGGAFGSALHHLKAGSRSSSDPKAHVSKGKGSESSTARALQSETNPSQEGVGRI